MATALTRLDLVQRLARWSGTELPSEITSTTSPATDHIGDLVAFVDQAWLDIQLHRNNDWSWMRHRLSDDSVALTASNRLLTMATIDATCRRIVPLYVHDVRPLRYVLLKDPSTSALHRAEQIDYDIFRGYRDRDTTIEGKPVRYTVRPDGTLEFDPAPDVAYKINLDWVHEPKELTADATEPDMPAHFHMLIVWWAIVHLMDFDQNGGRYQAADRQYRRMLNRLMIEQLPDDRHDEFLSTAEVYSW
jgi:hypothetical protein